MKKIIYLGVIPLFLNASLLDFQILDEAETSYKDGNYSNAIAQYAKLETKSDEVVYDEANSHYQLKDYKKALELYDSLSSPTLAFEKWHNLGNTQAQLGKLEEGIKAYEEALKIKDDKDTRFNLEFLKKKKKEQEQKENKNDKKNKDDKENKDDKNQKDKKNQKNKDSKDKKDSDSKKSDEEKKKEEAQKKKDEAQKKKEQEKKDAEKDSKKDENKTKEEQAQKAQMKKEPISDRELRKYQKMLDKRGINTLMVPLKTKGEQNDELKPW